jgi:hypothetical protein
LAAVITRQLAEAIGGKLKVGKSVSRKGSPHDLYEVEYNGRVVAFLSIHRGSKKEQSHNHVPRDLHISPHQAHELGRCPLSREQYLNADLASDAVMS